jgi:hypothetical protein
MRVDLTESGFIVVRLSRRNVLALLSKLDQPGSARVLVQQGAYVCGVLQEELVLVVHVEPDELHYAGRCPPGAMSPETEAFVSCHTPSSRARGEKDASENGAGDV